MTFALLLISACSSGASAVEEVSIPEGFRAASLSCLDDTVLVGGISYGGDARRPEILSFPHRGRGNPLPARTSVLHEPTTLLALRNGAYIALSVEGGATLLPEGREISAERFVHGAVVSDREWLLIDGSSQVWQGQMESQQLTPFAAPAGPWQRIAAGGGNVVLANRDGAMAARGPSGWQTGRWSGDHIVALFAGDGKSYSVVDGAGTVAECDYSTLMCRTVHAAPPDFVALDAVFTDRGVWASGHLGDEAAIINSGRVAYTRSPGIIARAACTREVVPTEAKCPWYRASRLCAFGDSVAGLVTSNVDGSTRIVLIRQ